MVCVPFAGAGASFFYPWNDLAGDEIEVVAVQPPGREWRIAEEPYRNATEAADGLFGELASELGGSGPVLLFGHSLGAVLAYELAHRFCAHPGFDVMGLMVSGSPGPWTRRTRRATGLPDEEFLERVREFASYDADTMRNPEVRELVLPTLRADVEMHENYAPSQELPAAGPDQLAARRRGPAGLGLRRRRVGRRDQPRVRAAVQDGGHMYMVADPGHVARGRPTRKSPSARPGKGRYVRLTGKSVILTGAARGLGRACAIAFAKEGADLALVDITQDLPGVPYPLGTASQLEHTAALCRGLGAAVLAIPADVRDLAVVERAVTDATERFGVLDVLVNNAGIAAPAGKPPTR